VSSGESSVARCVRTATVYAFGRGISGLFTDLALTALRTHWLCVAVPLQVVEPLATMALGGGPFLAGPLDVDEEVANRPQFSEMKGSAEGPGTGESGG
jgi:hypothetical protein